MKNISSCALGVLLFFAFAGLYTTNASAQSWSWGRGSDGAGDDAWAVATDPTGNVWGGGIKFGAGTLTFGPYTVPPSGGTGYQAMWVKYDNTGVPLWADGTTSGNTYLNNLATDPSGNVILFGSFTSASMTIGSFTLTNIYPAGTAQYFLAKVSPTGTVLWAVADGNIVPNYISIVGAWIMTIGGVVCDAAGDIYITSSYSKPTMTIGGTTLTNAGASGTYDIFVAKYTSAGVPVWAQSIGGTGNDYGFGVAVASTGYVYISGCFSSPTMAVGSSTISNTFTRPLAYVAKLSATGTPAWAEAGGGANGSFAVNIVSDNAGNVYTTGGFGDASITFGATTITRTHPSTPQLALFLVQYSASDMVTWSKTISSDLTGVWGYGIALASCGQVWVCGTYHNPITIDTATLAVVTDGKTGPDPVFIAGYNLTGGVVGYAGLSSGADDQVGIACDHNGNVFLCSDYFVPFTVGPDIFTGGTSEYFYVSKYANTIAPPDTARTHHDTAYCSADSLTLTAPPGYSTYYWDDGTGMSTRRVGATGTYIVICATCGVTTLVDTFHVFTSISDSSYFRHDSTVCRGIDSARFFAPPGYTSYVWSTGSTASSIEATATGIYYVKSMVGCSMRVDTFHFTIRPNDTTTARHDTSVCSSIVLLTLTAPVGYATYNWSTGSTAPFISVGASGTYRVISSNTCASKVDTFHVVFMPVPLVNLGNDTAFCIGNSITLSSPQPAGSTWLWSTSSTGSSIVVSTTGTYSLTVTYPNGCTTTDAITVTISPLPLVDLGPDTAICNGANPVIQSIYTYPPGSTYLWNTGATTSSIIATTIGTYWLRVTVVGCPSSDTLNVTNLYDTLHFPMIDTAICRGDYIQVRAAGTPGMTYQWTPTAGIANATMLTTTIVPDTSAMYYVRASISTCSDIIDSFYIDVQPKPVVFMGGNKFVCQYDSLHLHATVTPSWYTHYQYTWSPGGYLDDSTTSTVVFTGDSTKLFLTVTTPAGCTGRDSAMIMVHPGNFANLDATFHLCPHDSAIFLPTSTDPNTTYRWHPGLYLNDSALKNPTAHPITSLSYYGVATSSYGCLDTVHATVIISPAANIFLGDSVTLFPGESYQIPTKSNCMYFAWFPPAGLDYYNISSPTATPVVSTKYIVHASTEWGCKIVDSISIYVNSESVIDVPNAFSPGNGPNNIFRLLIRGIAKLNYFRIYNRWGNVVFETTNIEEGWDGKYKGVPQPFDVYVYQLDAVTNKGKVFSKKGNVTLLR